MSNYIILFFAHAGAIKFQRFMRKMGIDCQLQPVPRRLSSSCGVCAQLEYDFDYRNMIDKEHISAIYRKTDDDYILLYSCE